MKPTLLQPFLDLVCIDAEGVYPIPALYTDRDGKLVCAMLNLSGEEALHHVWRLISCENATELIFGFDRYTKPGQGTEFADVLTCAHWHPSFGDKWNSCWKPFVINYQHEPRIVRPPDFDNTFWNEKILADLRITCPPFRMKIAAKGASATT